MEKHFSAIKNSAAAILFLSSALLSGASVGQVRFIQQGKGNVSEAMLLHQIRLRPNLTFTREILDEDVKNLYRTGDFADIQAEISHPSKEKVDVTFKLRLKERIGKISFKGNAKFKTSDLGKLLTITEGGLLNSSALRNSTQALRKFYTERGYRDAIINPVFVPGPEGTTDVTFQIDEKLRLKVRNVEFKGAKLFSQFQLRHSVANQFSYMNYLPFVNDYLNFGLLDRGELAADAARLREKYMDAGYLDFKVTKTEVTPDPKDPEYVNITFTVDEGEPYKVGKISVSGAVVYKEKELLPSILLKTGNIWSLSKENASCSSLNRVYETLGYAEVTSRCQRIANPKTHTVDLKFEMTEGQKFSVRDVIITGNTATKSKVLRRELVIQPGDPVDKHRIEISRRRLLGMGYFQNVKSAVYNAESPKEKDVTFQVEEKERRYNFRLAAGVSDVNSVFGMAEASIDNFDLFNPKGGFYGGGQRLRLQGILGVENSGYNLDFVEPWLFDLPLRFELSNYINYNDFDDWDEQHIGVRTSLQRKIFDDFTTISAGYKFEVVRVTDVCDRLENYFDKEKLDGTFRVSQVSLMLGRDTRDSLINPTEGYNVNLFGSINPKIFGATSNYHRLEAKASYYKSFFDKFITAMIGAKIGTVSAFDRDEDVPVFERYFMGGGNSIRGFEYRSVSPTVNGKNIGGQTMLLVTAEISHAIWGPIRGAVFCDIGNAWRSSYTMNFSDINIGAGYGLRLTIPQLNVPIRLDLAYPILMKQDDCSSKFRFHFNVGAGFSL